MIGVNLMPASVLRRRAVERRVRGWLIACGVVAVAAMVPVGLELRQRGVAQDLEREGTMLSEDVRATRATLSAAIRRTDTLAEQLARAEALRAKNGWAPLLTAVGRSLPTEVWLGHVATVPRSPVGTGQSLVTAAPGEEIVMIEAPDEIRIDGYALEHAHLYDFMTRLKGLGVFRDVELERSDVRPFLRGQAVTFTLGCRW